MIPNFFGRESKSVFTKVMELLIIKYIMKSKMLLKNSFLEAFLIVKKDYCLFQVSFKRLTSGNILFGSITTRFTSLLVFKR